MLIDNGKPNLKYGTQPEVLSFEFMIETTIWHPVSFIKRNLFKLYGKYDESLKIVSDYDFYLKTVAVEKVKTQHLSFAISVFNTNGVGSLKEFDTLHKTERRIVQERYFSKEILDTTYQLINLRQSKAVIISEKLNRFKIIKKVFLFFYNIIVFFKKLLFS